jgi:hypothetical protein
MYKEYIYYKNNKDEFIMNPMDFDIKSELYKDSALYHRYHNLSDVDKLFIHDFIVYTMIDHKDKRPKFHKKLNNIKDGVILSALTSNLHSFSVFSILLSIQQNLFHSFVSL